MLKYNIGTETYVVLEETAMKNTYETPDFEEIVPVTDTNGNVTSTENDNMENIGTIMPPKSL